MYFRSSMRINPKTGELSGYYRLVESYRNFSGRVCHRNILTVGFLEGINASQLIQIQKGINDRVNGVSKEIFPNNNDDIVTSCIEKFYAQIVHGNRVDTGQSKTGKDWHTVDMNTLKNKDIREVGAEWLCMQAAQELKLESFLKNKGWKDDKISLALTHLISRAVYPASEYKTSRWIAENSGICEITKYDVGKITKDKLYQISHALYELKPELEQHLSKRTNELFDLQDKIFLYDLTNTYFEGEKRSSKIARFGRSKEKRSDARLVVLAVVINPEGFIKYSTIYQGNMADCKTLADMIDKLRQATSQTEKKALIVIDAGIASEENLALIREKGYDYLCVSRSNLKDYKTVAPQNGNVYVYDKKEQKIELCKVQSGQNRDYYLKVKSQAKAKKESAMNSRFKDRFEDGLKSIEASLHKKSGVKKLDKVHQRIGRLKQKYPSVQRFYQIDVSCNQQNIVTSVNWSLRPLPEPESNEGVYFLRTSLTDAEETLLWTFYNIIREIEYTFRVLKTDLDLRPIYHQNDDAAMAHLHLGLLAYWLVNTIRYQLKQKKINYDWSEIVRIMNTQKCVTTTVVTKKEETIIVRQCSEPETKAKQIYDTLKYKYVPFGRKKSVVHKPPPKKSENPDDEFFMRV